MKKLIQIGFYLIILPIAGICQLMNPPEIDEQNRVTFSVYAPAATVVKIINLSDEMAMGAAEYDLIKGDDGIWRVQTNPCRPGFHYFEVMIDGFRGADPQSQAYFGWGKWTSGLEIPATDITFYQPKNNPKGDVITHWYYSGITQTMRKCLVYTPPSYSKDFARKYPVLYLQHGAGESELGWTMQGKVNFIMDNLLAEGKAEEMLVVMDNGYAASTDAENRARPAGSDNLFEEVMIRELIPEIDRNFRTLTSKENRAIAGLSMGAGQAMRIGLSHPNLFSAIGAFSGGVRNFDRARSFSGVFNEVDKLNQELRLFWIGCGYLDGGFQRIKQFHEELEDMGIRHVWYEVDGSHEWQVWRHHLYEFAQLVFQWTNSNKMERSIPGEVYLNQFDFSQRKIPVIPLKNKKIRVIIDSDAKCEIDDQWALSLAFLSPERFDIVGLIGATYLSGGPESIERSCQEIDTIMKLALLDGKYPVYKGALPMRYPYEPSESEGVNFIIREAMAATQEDPLWIIGLGAPTDIASAFLKEPRIVDRVVVFWHLRTKWPEKCVNFNVFGDPHATRILFHSPLSFVLFDTGTFLTCPMNESEKKVRPHGELGKYLHDYRLGNDWMMSDTKGFYDLGDIAALVDPSLASFEVVDCPVVTQDLSYDFTGTKGKILRIYDINRDKTFELFYKKLKQFSADQEH
jgi:enterochelin esterase-like enzyme/inosine-uridine nucleoside N-ribohydrolase